MPAVATHPAALSLVVPTYNERERLADLVHAIFRRLRGPRASTASSSSSTTTRRTAPDGSRTTSRDSYRITVIHRAGKLGLGTAVVEGFERPARRSSASSTPTSSHPPEMLPRMLAVMNRTSADIVIGSRYIPGGGTRNWPFVAAC